MTIGAIVITMDMLATTCGLTIGIINKESGGAAFYPDINKFMKKLSVLDDEVDKLRKDYEPLYSSLERRRSSVKTINYRNQAIFTKMKEINKLVEGVGDRLTKLSASYQEGIQEVAKFSFKSTTLQDVIKFGTYGFGVYSILESANTFGKSFYNSGSLKALSNQLSNSLKGTNLSTNRLKLMEISKLQMGMAVIGVAMGVYKSVSNLKSAKAKRDALEKSVKEGEKTKNALKNNIEKLQERVKDLEYVAEMGISNYISSYRFLAEHIKELDNEENADKLNSSELNRLIQYEKEFMALPGCSDKQLALVMKSQDHFYENLTKLIEDYEVANSELMLFNLVESLIKNSVPIDTVLLAAKAVYPEVTNQDIERFMLPRNSEKIEPALN